MSPSVGWSVLFLKPQAFKPVSNLHEALGKPLPPHTPSAAKPRKIPIGGIRTFTTDYYDQPINQRSREARAWDISPPFLSSSGEVGLLQLDEGYDDEGHDYSEEEEAGPPSTDADSEAEVGAFLGPGGGHVEVVTQGEGSETDTSVSNSTSTASSEDVGFTSYYSFGAEIESSVEESEGDSRVLAGVFGPVGVVELVQDSEGEAGAGGREKHVKKADKVRESGRRRKASDEGREGEAEDDDDEEEKPAQVFIFSYLPSSHP